MWNNNIVRGCPRPVHNIMYCGHWAVGHPRFNTNAILPDKGDIGEKKMLL